MADATCVSRSEDNVELICPLQLLELPPTFPCDVNMTANTTTTLITIIMINMSTPAFAVVLHRLLSPAFSWLVFDSDDEKGVSATATVLEVNGIIASLSGNVAKLLVVMSQYQQSDLLAGVP